jgi:hypothetical protein
VSNLVQHAQKELALIGMFDSDADYNGALGKVILDLVTLFASQAHSGYSAPTTVALFSKLAMFEPLSPLTYEPDEWDDRSDISGYPLWQNNRDSRVFSLDGGKTHWRV